MYKVLIIDKDPQTAALAGSVLTMKSYVIRSATNNTEAKEIMNEWSPDVILLDLPNQESDAISFLQQIKKDKRFRSIPVITMVNIENRELIGQALEYGAAETILKPLRKDELFNRTEWLCQQQAQQQYIRELQATVEKKDINYSIVSKRLRSSIHSIKLMSNSLMHTLGKDRIEKDEFDLLSTIYEEAADAALVWDNFLKSNSYNPDLCRPRKQRVDINSILCNIANSYLPVAQQKDVTLFKEGFDSELLADVDVEMFRSVVRNLVSNAIRYNQPGGQVILSAYSHPEDQCIVKVQRSSLTDATLEEKRGNGWELCNSYAQAHQGKIWFDTKENHGTSCYFSFTC